MAKPKNNDQRMDLRLPKELVSSARKKAKQEKRPLSQVVRDLLRSWVASSK